MSGLEFIIFGIFKALVTKAGVAAVAHAPAPVLMHGAQQVVSTAVSSGSLASGAHTLYHGARFGYKVLKYKKKHGLTANGQKIGKDINEAKIDRAIKQAGGNEEQLMAAACAWVLEDDYVKRGNLNRNGKKKTSLEEMEPCQEFRCPDFSGFDIADDSECADCGCDASSHNSTSKHKMERAIWAFAFEHCEDMENRDEEGVFKITWRASTNVENAPVLTLTQLHPCPTVEKLVIAVINGINTPRSRLMGAT